MSENEFDVQRERTEDDRDSLVLTGEEIELPGEDSDASAIIGESSEPIDTGEIESVAIGSLTGRVPAAAPLKPAIEDRIATGELPVVPALADDAPGVSSDEAEAVSGPEQGRDEAPASDSSAAEGQPEPSATAEAAESVPADSSSEAPDAAPAETAPTAEPVTRETPVQEVPAQHAPREETRGADAPADEDPTQEAARVDAPAEEAGAASTSAEDTPDAGAVQPADQNEADAPAEDTPAAEAAASTSEEAAPAEAPFSSLDTSTSDTDTPGDEPTEEPAPTRSPVMTPAQAAAVLGLSLDTVGVKAAEGSTQDTPSPDADAPEEEAPEAARPDADAPEEEAPAEIGGAAAQGSSYPLPSRRRMIFGDEEPAQASIPPLSTAASAAPAVTEPAPSWERAADPEPAGDAPETTGEVAADTTTQLPTQAPVASYSFEDQDAAEAAQPRRRSLLADDERDAATLAAIASSAARGGGSGTGEAARLDDELFSAAPQVTEMPSRTGAHWLSLLGFLILTPLAWYLAADAGARMTLADSASMYTGVASFLALGELLGAVVVAAVLCALARRSSLGAWIMGVVTLLAGLPWVLAPGVTASSLLASLTALSETGPVGANLTHHLQASGYSGRFVVMGVFLMGVAYVSHSARRTGRSEEALRTSLESVNPAGAFYSKRARKRAAKDAGRK